MTQDPKDLVRAYVDAFNSGDLDRLCDLFSDDALIWGVLGWGNVQQVRPIWKDLMESLQIHLHVQDLVAEGAFVAARYFESGSSAKPFRGYPKTGKTYEVIAMEWFEIQDGKIHRRWGARDSASIYRQLGFLDSSDS